MKKTITLLLFLIITASVKSQVFIEMVNTTGSTIDNLIVSGRAYGAIAPDASKIIELPTVQSLQGVPYFNFWVKIKATDFSARKEPLGMAYTRPVSSGTYKVNIILSPGQHADIQLVAPAPRRLCGNELMNN